MDEITTIYTVKRGEYNSFVAHILKPNSSQPVQTPPYGDIGQLQEVVQSQYGSDVKLVSNRQFDEDVERRTTHTAEILAMLKDNWTGQDLRDWHVYGSILRPMAGIKIDGTVFLNGNGGRYEQYEIHTYVIAREPLDARTIERYTLIPVSHP